MAQHPLFDMTGKVALITGSSRGIGKAIAEAMAQAGAKVVISSRKADVCDAVVAEFKQKGYTAIAIPASISRKEELQKLVSRTESELGPIDALVCNAAINPYYGPLLDISDDAFDKIMASNIKSNVWLAGLVMPGMASRGGGSVTIISSVGGLIGNPVIGAYCISKAADMQLARNLAVEWGPKNIRVNCISPGLIKTDFARALWENPETVRKATHGYPLRRIGNPEEVAGVALMLAAKAGTFITGQSIVVDGGGTISQTAG